MPNRTTTSYLVKGFTLLEIMLVLLLISMASVTVMMAMPHSINGKESVDWQAQRFATQLQFAQDQALITGQELALVFEDDSYRFTFYDHESKKWLAIFSEQFESFVEIPESLSLEYTLLGSVWDEIETEEGNDFIDEDFLVQIEGDDDDETEGFSPQVYIMSSGEVTPFQLTFSKTVSETTTGTSSVEVNMSGVITYIKPGDE